MEQLEPRVDSDVHQKPVPILVCSLEGVESARMVAEVELQKPG